MPPQSLARTQTARLLDLLLEAPDLVQQVRALPGPAVARMVQRVGLEDSGELLALLTTEQLTELTDDVLWDAEAPGADETFNPRRFATWLEVMLEAGEDFAANQLAELSEDLLALAVSRLAMVLDYGEVEAEASDAREGELVEKALDSCLHQEIGDYFLVALQYDGWDALVAALLALDARHTDVLERILYRCWSAAHEQLEETGGLYSLLTELDVLQVDAAAEREDRRAALGYVSPASARAFLRLAAPGMEAIEPGQDDPVTRAYFREIDVARVRRRREPAPPARSVARLLESAAPGAPAPRVTPAVSALRQVLNELAASAPECHSHAVEELAYLTNVLVAGDGSRGRPWRPAEAADRVMAICERGLGRLCPADATRVALLEWGLVAAFRAGYGSVG